MGSENHDYLGYSEDGEQYQQPANYSTEATSPISEEDESVKLFIGQIPKHLDEEALQPVFDEFGQILELTVIRDKATKLHRGCAFLTYAHKQSAARAIHALHDKVKLDNAVNPLQIRPAESQAERENKIFVGMLPKTMNDLDLHDMFAPFGPLKEIHIIRGPDGHSKGCAFVKFVERDSAMLAIHEMNDTLPEGSSRPLVIKFADNKKMSREEGEAYGPEAEEYWMQQMQSSAPPAPMVYPGSPPTAHHHAAPPAAASYGPYGSSVQPLPSQHMYYPSTSHGQPPGGYYLSPEGSPMGGHHHAAMSPPHHHHHASHVQPPSMVHMDGGRGGHGHYGGHSHGGGGGGGRGRGNNDRPAEGPNGANLFIYHLPRDLTDADLATLFAPFGVVISAKVYVDKKTAESKGFGFVSYDAVHAAESAIEAMNGFQIGSKRLKVQHKRTGGGGGGGYGGGGYGGGGYGGGGYNSGYRSAPPPPPPTYSPHAPHHHHHPQPTSGYYPGAAPHSAMPATARYAPQPSVYSDPYRAAPMHSHGHQVPPPSSAAAYDPQYAAYLAQLQQQQQYRDVPEIGEPGREPSPHQSAVDGADIAYERMTQKFDQSLRVSPGEPEA